MVKASPGLIQQGLKKDEDEWRAARDIKLDQRE